jgi:hypothetical protein
MIFKIIIIIIFRFVNVETDPSLGYLEGTLYACNLPPQ